MGDCNNVQIELQPSHREFESTDGCLKCWGITENLEQRYSITGPGLLKNDFGSVGKDPLQKEIILCSHNREKPTTTVQVLETKV